MRPVLVRRCHQFTSLAVSLWIALVAAASAQPSPGLGFAPIEIAPDQGVRLKALNKAKLAKSNPSSCKVTFQLRDSRNRILKQTTVNLQPGATGTLDLSFEEIPGKVRSAIRGALLFGYSGGANPPAAILRQTACGNLVPSLEVYDKGTARASMILTETTALPPPPKPPQ